MQRFLSLAVVAGGVLAADAASAVEQTVTLAVQNMTCASCPYIVKKTLAAVPGVKTAEVSFSAKTATVTFDDEKASVEALTKATANAGYPSTLRK